jgi:site-specific DNA-methyltransferase (adenine-specific)
MQEIPDESIDMILCDLPYGTTANDWDTVIPFEPLWEQYTRIIKPNAAICLFSQPPFDKRLAMSNPKLFRYEWIWRKRIATGFLNARRAPLKIHENILVFYKHLPQYHPQMRQGKPYKHKGGKLIASKNYHPVMTKDTENNGERFPVDILEFSSERGLHPTQKPVTLLEYLIRTYTAEGDLVLDNCIGSGSTAVACINTNRRFVGFETSKTYYDIAIERIEKAKEAVQNATPNQ